MIRSRLIRSRHRCRCALAMLSRPLCARRRTRRRVHAGAIAVRLRRQRSQRHRGPRRARRPCPASADAGLVQVTYVTEDWWLTQKLSMAVADKDVTRRRVLRHRARVRRLQRRRVRRPRDQRHRVATTPPGAVYVLYGAVGGLASDHTKHSRRCGTRTTSAPTNAKPATSSVPRSLPATSTATSLDDLAIGVPGENGRRARAAPT